MEILIMGISLLALAFLFILFLLKWNEILFQRKGLPPGTMGWPFFGETDEFLKLGPEFMKKQKARYGRVFKTHILGSPTIISTDPELNKYILLNESKGLVPGYPQSMLYILGTRNIGAVYGSTHKYLRGNLLSLVGTSLLKDRLFPKLHKYMSLHLSNWDGMIVDIQQKTKDMAFFISLTQIAEVEWTSIYDSFKFDFDKMFIGTLSLPINLPGSKYYQGLKCRRNVVKNLKQIMKKRRACSGSTRHDDMLDYLLRGDEDAKYALNDEDIIDQIITILHSGYETVSTTSMMAIKYLHDNQDALQQLRNEHFTIKMRKGAAEEQLDWNDYKSMRFTRAVVFETLRLATVVNGVLRKTTQDLQLNGFVVPKGWRVYVYTREINYDPILYPEPLKFNPWRWMDNEKLESHKYFLLFGGGSRMCPGKELGIVKVSMFLYYFVTKYRWEEVGGEKILEFPRVEAPNGYHIRVMKL